MEHRQIIPADTVLPPKLIILPLHNSPMFPGVFTPMMIPEGRDERVVRKALNGDGCVGLVMLRGGADEEPRRGAQYKLGADDLHAIGTAAKIVRKINLPDGGINIFLSTLKRFRIAKLLSSEAPVAAAVEYLDNSNMESLEVRALTRALITEMKQISENNPLFSEEMRLNMVNIDDPGKIADFVASILNIDGAEKQSVLDTLDVRERMERVLVFIKKEQELLRIQKRIQDQLNQKIEKSQREYFLKEQLKAIKTELGMPVDAKSSEHQRLSEAFEQLELHGEARERVDDEMEKFALMDPSSAEFVVTRNYLETIAALPWHEPDPKLVDLGRAQRRLERDHYGLEDVKERVLEYLAVGRLKAGNGDGVWRGSIICLVGPPGVGKTSIGKSIAGALGREFFRFSVGGMRDEAEIKGHRRTYVGAMPGKIIQGLKIAKVRDAVFMIDEIDKLGASFQGDPSSALLEVLDGEQNHAFRDHYLDLPFDISPVMFIATANTVDTIPAPLLDRMEVIRLSGYVDQEKVNIARRYLIPKSLERTGIGKNQIKYQASTLRHISHGWAREAGVRNFEKALDRIHRKVARKMMTDDLELPIRITPERLEDFLGKPVFGDEQRNRITAPGMVMGLAWTALGGAVLMVEAVANVGRGGITLTGKMGEVMQESANIAYSFVRLEASRHGVRADYFDNHRIHLHIPAGATPKDGPSAGITMACALLSLVTGRRVRRSLAMTGELSLVGKVLPVGGLKEKVIAARRNKVREIVFPSGNSRDLDEIADNIKKGVVFTPVDSMDEVVERLF
ncbi:MAG: endopeptidase La [Spirochaetaceae bacterium]|nr:endopeptidase La [Spirochaetaceae bacterium]